jgi:hypothetical protein
MPRKPEPLAPWMEDAIQLMIRKDLTLRQAAQQLGHEMSVPEADNIQGRLRFQDALEEARLQYYAEIGSNPRLSKDALIGKVYLLSERLASDREDAKASEALFRLAKIQGWIAGEGAEQPSPIELLARLLTDSDLEELKGQIQKAEEQGEEKFDLAKAIVELKVKQRSGGEASKPEGAKAKVN